MSTTTSNAGRSAYTRERPVISYVEPNDPCLKAIYMRVMERFLGSQEVQRIYDELKRTPFELKHFIADALCLASINVERSGEIETVISDQGPVVFVANHRFGIVDGAVLCDLATRTRGTFGIIIYSVLCQDKDLVLYFLPIDFESNRAAVRNHVNTRRRARKMLENEEPCWSFRQAWFPLQRLARVLDRLPSFPGRRTFANYWKQAKRPSYQCIFWSKQPFVSFRELAGRAAAYGDLDTRSP